jgi:hypothetical protein
VAGAKKERGRTGARQAGCSQLRLLGALRRVTRLYVFIDWTSQKVVRIRPDGGSDNGDGNLRMVGTPSPELGVEDEAWEEKFGNVASSNSAD